MTDTPTNETNEQFFDGNELSPQFSLAIKKFIAKNNGMYAKGGVSSIVTNPGVQQTFAHNLGVVPNIYGISALPVVGGSFPVTNVGVLSIDTSKVPDATNIYLMSTGSVSTITFSWFVAFIPTA